VEDLLNLLGDKYSILKLDKNGNFIYTNLPIAENATSFLDIIRKEDRAKGAKLLIDATLNGSSEENLLVENDGYLLYYFRFIFTNDKLIGIAKEIEKLHPSFISDLLGNVREADDEWQSLLDKNIFDVVEDRERFLKIVSEAIEKGEYEGSVDVNGKKKRIKIKTNDMLEFYIKDDSYELIKEIATSKSSDEAINKISNLLEVLSYKNFEVVFDGKEIKKGEKKNKFLEIPLKNGYIKIYDEKKEEILNIIPYATEIASELIKTPSFIINDFPLCFLNEDGKIIEISKKFEELTGYGNEIVGKNINNFSPHQDLLANIKEGKIRSYITKWNEKWIKESAWEIGKKIMLVMEDVTEEKEKMDEAEFYNSLLRHDIYNKNEIALGYLGLLEKANIGKRQKEKVEKAKKAIEEGNKLIESVRKMQEIKKGKRLKKIRLDSEINKICSSLRPAAAQAGIEMECSVAPASVVADDFVGEIFSNIIGNAIEHSQAKKINVYGKNINDIYEVIIEDNGKGIPEEFIDKIFEEGWKQNSKGSGIGLYIVKKLMDRYGGKIKVESLVSKGTKFILHFRKTKKREEFLRIRF